MFRFNTFAKKQWLMKLGDSLKRLRESKGYTQQQMADLIHTHRSGYSKMENNQQEIPVDCLILIAKNFGMSVDDVIFFDEKNGVPNEVSMEDKAALEQLQLINELEPEEKGILFKLIEAFVSKKRFKDYLQKNIAAL
jgi:transcriptional regulator with XRE-family HTH domain